jgi:hypothetical protein
MATKGGKGTVEPPTDGEDVAPVIPLRRREGDPADTGVSRGLLPQESAPFDPEFELAPVKLRRRLHRRVGARLAAALAGSRRLGPRSTAPLMIVTGSVVVIGVGSALVIGALTSRRPGPGSRQEGNVSAAQLAPPNKPTVERRAPVAAEAPKSSTAPSATSRRPRQAKTERLS